MAAARSNPRRRHRLLQSASGDEGGTGHTRFPSSWSGHCRAGARDVQRHTLDAMTCTAATGERHDLHGRQRGGGAGGDARRRPPPPPSTATGAPQQIAVERLARAWPWRPTGRRCGARGGRADPRGTHATGRPVPAMAVSWGKGKRGAADVASGRRRGWALVAGRRTARASVTAAAAVTAAATAAAAVKSTTTTAALAAPASLPMTGSGRGLVGTGTGGGWLVPSSPPSSFH